MIHLHNYISFKGNGGGWPCVSEYCTKCGKIRSGNSIYYDGSIYQNYYKGTEAIKYLSEVINEIKNLKSSYAEFTDVIKPNEDNKVQLKNLEFMHINRLRDFETIDKYEEIKRLIK